MNLSTNDMFIGIVAGLATALLCLGVATGSGLSVTLYLLSAVPIMAAGLGWGLRASLIGIVVSSIAVVMIANTQTAVLVLLTTSLPAAASAYWLTLSRPAEEVGGPEGKLVWYPLSDVLLRLCLMVSAAFIFVGAMINYGPELLEPIVDQMAERIRASDPQFAFTDAARQDLLETLTALIPVLQPLMWTLILVGNLYLALRITRASGQLRRRKDDFPNTMRMPKISLVIFAVALLLSMLSGSIGLIGSAISGGMIAGFTLAGFAMFHAISRGKPWRTPALVMVYVGTFFMFLPAFILFLIGLVASARTQPLSNFPNQST